MPTTRLDRRWMTNGHGDWTEQHGARATSSFTIWFIIFPLPSPRFAVRAARNWMRMQRDVASGERVPPGQPAHSATGMQSAHMLGGRVTAESTCYLPFASFSQIGEP